MKTFFEFENSALADYEICDILINNLKSEISLKCVDPKQNDCLFTIERVLSFSYSHREPWGKGSYVASSLVENYGSLGRIVIELNSGDNLTIEFANV